MKKLLPLLIMAVIASCGPSRYLECPKYVGIAIDTIIDTTVKRDTVPEWMYTYTTRGKSFVIAHKALSVRAKGFCVEHLQCDGKPLKWPYRVGWCQGKDELLNRLIKGRAK